MTKFPRQTPAPEPPQYFHERFGSAALDKFPDAKAAIADTVTKYAEADSNVRIFVMSRLSPDADLSQELQSVLRKDDDVKLMLKLCLASSGRGDLRNAVAQFLHARQQIKRFRDSFCHGVWSCRSDLSDRLLLRRADTYRKAYRELLERFSEVGAKQPNLGPAEVWAISDFDRATRVSQRLIYASNALAVCFSRPPPEHIQRFLAPLEKDGLLDVQPWDLKS